MLKKRTIQGATLALAALAALAITSAAPAGGTTTVTISHQMRGCHMWQVGNGSPRASLSVTVDAGTVLTFVNNDIMPHKLLQSSGPKLRLTHANMNHMSASTSVKLVQKGIYSFTTKPGEDYKLFTSTHTIGADHVLHLSVRVK